MLISYVILWIILSIFVGYVYLRKTGSFSTALIYGAVALLFQMAMYMFLLFAFFPRYVSRL